MFGGPHNNDYGIWVSILGSPHFLGSYHFFVPVLVDNDLKRSTSGCRALDVGFGFEHGWQVDCRISVMQFKHRRGPN